MAEEIKQGMTRREVLKKGAVVGGTLGAVMWVAPVVRAADIGASAVELPSETSCCLRLVSLVITDAPPPGGSDWTATLTVQNCSSHASNKDYDVRGRLQRLRVNPGGSYDESSAVELTGSGGSLPFIIGLVNAEQIGSAPYTEPDVPGGDWVYRAHGLYRCNQATSPVEGQNVPSAFWLYSLPFTSPAPTP